MKEEGQLYLVIACTAFLGLIVGFTGGYIIQYPPKSVVLWVGALSGWVAALGALVAATLTVRSLRQQITHQQLQHTFDNIEAQISELTSQKLSQSVVRSIIYNISDHIGNVVNCDIDSKIQEFHLSRRIVRDLYIPSIERACLKLPVNMQIYYEEASSLLNYYINLESSNVDIINDKSLEILSILEKYISYADEEVERISRVIESKNEIYKELGDRLLAFI